MLDGILCSFVRFYMDSSANLSIDYDVVSQKEMKKNKKPIDLCLTRRKVMPKNNIVQSL